MADITHKIGLKSPVSEVYKAITTVEGLAGWWTTETSGEPALGGNLVFSFKADNGEVKGRMNMKVVALEPNKKVQWRCEEGPADWIGTDFTFDLNQQGEFAILIFGHRNWKEQSESFAHCSMKWATFMMSLGDLVKTGKGRPSPNDIKIDNWN